MHCQLALLALAARASADCTRAYLKNAASAYLNSQTTGDLKSFAAYSVPNVTLTENFKPVNIGNSTLTIPLKVDYNFSAYDTIRCATFSEIIAASNPHPYITHTRIEYGDNNGKAALVESIVTDKGDWIFNATKTLSVTLTESWGIIPEAQRDTRHNIQAAGDAYWNRFAGENITVPWGAPCYRLEGSEVVSGRLHNDTGLCEMSWPRVVFTPQRRYVVDEELGFVDIFLGFPGLDRTQGDAAAPDSHAFRVEKGRIKYVHTASECVVAGCGLNGTTRPPLDPPVRLH